MATKLSYRHIGAKAFSHSRLELLDTCARKFELEGKLNIRQRRTNLTFAYGHAFGEGVQGLIEGKSFEQVVWEVFRDWEVDISEEGFKSEIANKKNFFDVIDMIEKFQIYISGKDAEGLEGNTRKIDWNEWEIAKWKDYDEDGTFELKNAVELELEVDLGNGYFYEGHIDLVIKRKDRDHFMVVEIKSTGLAKVEPAIYGNSPQPTGYMMALDSFLAKEDDDSTTSFDVLYLVGQTKTKMFFELLFTKTPLHRTQWLSFIIGKMSQVDMLEDSGLPYPINFKSCYAYYRPCEHFGTCHLPNEKLLEASPNKDTTFELETSPVDIQTSLDAIIVRQQHLLESYETIELAEMGGEILLDLQDDKELTFLEMLEGIQIQ